MAEPPSLVVVGGGGHAREVLDLVTAANVVEERYRVLGYVALAESAVLRDRGVRWLGDDAVLPGLGARRADHVIAIGASSTRARIDAEVTAHGLRAATLVHPAASVGAGVRLGPGTVVAAGARVTTDVVLGRHVHLNCNATVAHDCVLGNHVTVGPLASLSGGVVVGDRVAVGAGSALVPGVRVGAGTVVGAGAVVTGDLPAGVTAVGVPARPLPTRRGAGRRRGADAGRRRGGADAA